MKRNLKPVLWFAVPPLFFGLVVLGARYYDAIPGTLVLDAHGARGTGDYRYRYASGATKLVEKYYRGHLVRSEWFEPDGTSIQVTLWKDGCGEGLYLREDGSIRRRLSYVHDVWDGPSTYYNRDGTVRGTAMGRNGQRVEGYQPEAGEQDP